jgi:hypothetical protein
MRLRPVMTGAVCVLAAGIATAGCSSASSASASGSSATAAAAGAAAATGTPASTPSAGTTPLGGVPTPGGGTGGATATCQPSSLRIALGTVTGTGQRTQAVDLTNTGSSACAMDGFPGTNLTGTAVGPQNYSKQGYTWPLVRASRSYSAVTLQPGGTAHFDLIYLPSESSDIASGSKDLNVTTIVITPPNDFSHAEVSWSQDVLLQDGATHPGTYVTPVASGA